MAGLREFIVEFGTEEQCIEYLAGLRWPGGFACAGCGGRHAWRLKARFRVYECATCHRQESATAGTLLHRTRTDLTKWFVAAYLMGRDKRGVSAKFLQRELGVAYQTAWTMAHKPNLVMQRTAPGYRPQAGDVGPQVILQGALGGANTVEQIAAIWTRYTALAPSRSASTRRAAVNRSRSCGSAPAPILQGQTDPGTGNFAAAGAKFSSGSPDATTVTIAHTSAGGTAWTLAAEGSSRSGGQFDIAVDGRGAHFSASGSLRIDTNFGQPLFTPKSSSAPCEAGTTDADADFVSVCTAPNIWKRAALSAF